MKKKTWTIILIILAVLAIACAVYFIWFHDYKKYYMPEVEEPEVFHDIEFDADLLPGLWKEDELYYRYSEDGTAVTWDLADDVMEELDDETMNKVSGAGGFNPFGDVPRVPLQEIQEEQRENI